MSNLKKREGIIMITQYAKKQVSIMKKIALIYNEMKKDVLAGRIKQAEKKRIKIGIKLAEYYMLSEIEQIFR